MINKSTDLTTSLLRNFTTYSRSLASTPLSLTTFYLDIWTKSDKIRFLSLIKIV